MRKSATRADTAGLAHCKRANHMVCELLLKVVRVQKKKKEVSGLTPGWILSWEELECCTGHPHAHSQGQTQMKEEVDVLRPRHGLAWGSFP